MAVLEKKKFEESIKTQQDEVAKAIVALASSENSKAVTDRKGMLDLIKLVSSKLDALIQAEYNTRVIIANQFGFANPQFNDEYETTIKDRKSVV